MGKTRKEQLIGSLEKMIGELEEQLIDTPAGMSNEEYRALIENLKNARKMLETTKKM
jgi:MinD superfamily P-loop ATPase